MSESRGIVGDALEEELEAVEAFDEAQFESLNLIQAINKALMQEMERDERVIVLGEDVGINGGVFRATEGLYEQFGEYRVIDTPLAESGIVGVSIGMARQGKRPVAELQFMGFLPPALDQLISHAARYRNRTSGDYHLPLVVRMPYGGGIRAPELHAESMEVLLAHIPGLKTVIPSNAADAKGLLISAIRDPDPVIYLEPKKIYRRLKEPVPRDLYETPIGKARLVREGKDVTVIAWGAMMIPTEEAVEKTARDNIKCELIDLRTIMPYDRDTILESIEKSGRAVIVHEAPKSFGPAAELIAKIQEEALLSLEAPIQRVTGYDTAPPMGDDEDLYMPNVARISTAIKKTMEF